MSITQLDEVAVPDPSPPKPDLGGPPYLWSDLLARRNALALRTEDVAELLDINVDKYFSREWGSRTVGAYLVGELVAMEYFVSAQEEALTNEALTRTTGPAEPGEAIILNAIVDQEQFEKTHPQARTQRDRVPYPAMLHDVAVGRATAELTRRGYDVEVHRGDRRADLTARRLAAGLLKFETAELFGMTKKKYFQREYGKEPPPAGLIAELQAIDDFITTTAAQSVITERRGVSMVHMIDDHGQYEVTYPQARTRRDARTYPMRVLRVAAGRRAGMLERDGHSARIVVCDS